MYNCIFRLNNRPMSTFTMGAFSCPAFSGMKPHINQPGAACLAGLGPIPPGSYFILDRKEGGLLAPLRNLVSDHGGWFALYRVDEKIDDATFCDKVRRGEFRLHPRGPLGISKGCITLDKLSDFQFIQAALRHSTPFGVPGTSEKAYGVVAVTW